MIKEGQTISTNYTGETYKLTGVKTTTSGAKKKTKKKMYSFTPIENATLPFSQTEEEFKRLVARNVFTIND